MIVLNSLPHRVNGYLKNRMAKKGNDNLTIDIYVASLIIENRSGLFNPTGEVIDKDETAVLLKHGPYCYSKYESVGGWILLGRSRAAVETVISDAVNSEKILAVATIEKQWEVNEGKGSETAAVLAQLLSPQVPGSKSLSETRSAEIVKDIEKLCVTYIERENKFRNFTIDTLPLDRRAFSIEEIDSDMAMPSDLCGIHRPLLDLLDYYWESVFMIWWKGFW